MIQQLRFLLLILGVSIGFQLTAQPEVFFEIRNGTIANGKYSFDIFMRASQGGTFHSRGQVYLFYNTSAFGNVIVANNRLAHTEMDLLTEPDLFGGTKYQTVNVTDNGNRAVITWQMVYQSIPASNLTHTVVPDTFTPLYHFEMEMVNTSVVPVVSFDLNLMGAQQFYLVPNGVNEIQYSLALPVNWSYFDAEKIEDRNVELRWATESETNNDFFEVEKDRGDGVFEAIGRVDGNGTTLSSNAYVFLDETDMGNRNAYRIKQVDLDGNFSYSETVEVIFDYFGRDQFKVFPVPMREKLTLLAAAKEERPYPYRVTDIYGKEMLKGVLGTFSRAEDIPVGHLPRGNYLLVVDGPGQLQYTFRLSK